MIYLACQEDSLQILDGGVPHCTNWHFQPIVQSGFDQLGDINREDFKAGLSATLGIFAIGLVVGAVLSIIKKAR